LPGEAPGGRGENWLASIEGLADIMHSQLRTEARESALRRFYTTQNPVIVLVMYSVILKLVFKYVIVL
jgi:hypothetical protein